MGTGMRFLPPGGPQGVRRASFDRDQQPECRVESAGIAARSRNAAAAAEPPRACGRPAERSSFSATASSGPGEACALCQARRSGSTPGSVTSTSAWCTSCLS
jgi:hypothetical protein